jgi:hypothetical protein
MGVPLMSRENKEYLSRGDPFHLNVKIDIFKNPEEKVYFLKYYMTKGR